MFSLLPRDANAHDPQVWEGIHYLLLFSLAPAVIFGAILWFAARKVRRPQDPSSVLRNDPPKLRRFGTATAVVTAAVIGLVLGVQSVYRGPDFGPAGEVIESVELVAFALILLAVLFLSRRPLLSGLAAGLSFLVTFLLPYDLGVATSPLDGQSVMGPVMAWMLAPGAIGVALLVALIRYAMGARRNRSLEAGAAPSGRGR